MDKNFVNIDDLVRQRLSGGEEQERSGAWLRMREVLDKEMPRDRVVGAFYWRRMFGALGVLLLVSMITVGGYELAALRSRNANNADGLVASIATTPSANAPLKDNNANNEANTRLVSAPANTENNTAATTNNSETKAQPAHKQHNNKLAVTPDEKTTANQSSNEKPTGKSSAKTALLAANDKSADKVTANEVIANKTAAKEAVKETVAANNTVSKPVAKKEIAFKEVAVKEVAVKTPVSKTAVKEAGSTQEVKIAKKSEVAAVTKDTHKTVAKTAAHGVKEEKMEKLPLGSKAPAINNDEVAASAPVAEKPAQAAKQPVGDKLAISAHAPAAKNIPAIANTAGVPASVGVANSNTKPAADKKAGTTAANKTSSVAANTSAKPVVPVAAKPAVDNTAVRLANEAAAKKGKKVMQKLVLLERYIKITPTEGYYHIDTISMEEVTEEMGLASENKPYLPKTSRKPGATGLETGDNTATADAQILPGATTNANGKPALGTKEATTGKKSAGAVVLESLSAAFNDIKHTGSNVKFAPGLTAGINGTFFGPNSFKGFQFGVTGSLMFGGDWSIMTAVEYFHRINGNYSMSDNYYDYTPNVAGGYNKQLHENWYSFSTLHSFEMPIAFRYTTGDFGFFAGGNLVYTMAINTGAAQLPPGNNTPAYQVATTANDNAPKLNASDFNSRFGIGCLFGLSYQVSPNVSLDLRNVMTVWDNTRSTGAKYVSDQLYKSPSIQFSMGYRFGGAKK